MKTAEFRIESNSTLSFRLMPDSSSIEHLFHDRAMAIAMAAKAVTDPPGEEIRVIHVPTRQVIFRMPATALRSNDDL